jgi:secreted trypsin-like serine protease
MKNPSRHFRRTIGLLLAVECASGPPAIASEVEMAVRGLAPPAVAETACARIVGGTCTTQRDWPWQTALYYRLNDGRELFMCGGSLIAPNWVLSAAHCFGSETSDRAEDWTVADDVRKLSFIGLPAGATTRAVKRVIRHEKYDPATQANDIALLELESPLPAKTISPLVSDDPSLETNRETMVTGWGIMRWVEAQKDAQGHVTGYIDGASRQPVDPKKYQSPDLREATLPLVDVAECGHDYESIGGSIDRRNLCAGLPKGGRDSCQGDSGGPLMAQTPQGEWRQIGIVSWGHGCAQAGFPGIYTRVSAFADWIQSKVNGEVAPNPAPFPADEPSNVPDNPAGLTVDFDKGDDVTVGETVAYVAAAKRPGYLAIFDVGPDGQLTQVYPNAASLSSPTGGIQNSRLDPSHPVLVPNYRNPYGAFSVRIAEPRGEGVMVAVLSDQPLKSLDTPQAPKTYDKASALSLIRRLRQELARNLTVAPDGAAHPPWSVAAHKYVVH